jgi:hypothetical protein
LSSWPLIDCRQPHPQQHASAPQHPLALPDIGPDQAVIKADCQFSLRQACHSSQRPLSPQLASAHSEWPTVNPSNVFSGPNSPRSLCVTPNGATSPTPNTHFVPRRYSVLPTPSLASAGLHPLPTAHLHRQQRFFGLKWPLFAVRHPQRRWSPHLCSCASQHSHSLQLAGAHS